MTNNSNVDKIQYKHPNPLVKWYFFKILKTAVTLADLKGGETVLDFGCNTQRLKAFLPNTIKYVGYDIVQKYSDVKDYQRIKTDVVFALNVFEHFESRELAEVLEYFERTGVEKLVVAIPTENIGSKLAAYLSGIYHINKQLHKLKWKEIHRMLAAKHWKKAREKNIITFSKIGIWLK